MTRPDPIFCDTVTLSNFALVRRLDLLERRLGARLHGPGEVRTELILGVAAGNTNWSRLFA